MMKPIPYGRQEITEKDIEAVVAALRSDYLTQGPKINEFETAFAKYVDAKFAVAVSNGTAALHLAVMALGIKENDYVICTPITFAASVNCVQYCGGKILFADIDPDTYLIDIESVRSILENNKDKTIRGIIPVDFAGRVPQLDAFMELALEHDLWIIEDACHAPGGFFIDNQGRKQKAGNGAFADVSVFSFHPVKHIATGEGGMITTNNEDIYYKLLKFRTHGITKEKKSFKNTIALANGNQPLLNDDYPGWYMEMQELGYNYRLTDFQATLGISQLERAETNLEKRKEIAKIYTDAFIECSSILNSSGWVDGHAYHLYVLEVENRRELYDYLKREGVFSQIHYVPVHLMPYYKEQGWKEGDFPNAERYYSRCISIPMFPSLTQSQIKFILKSIIDFYK